MDSADKRYWWQKKTFWGAALAVIAGGLAELPPLEPYRVLLKSLEGLGFTLAGYGAVEVARSYAAATKQQTRVITGEAMPKPVK